MSAGVIEPANNGRIRESKTSHFDFEEVQIRQIGTKGSPLPLEPRHVESALLIVAMIDLIRSLHRQGLSHRQIASGLGINRETVARYFRQTAEASEPAVAPSARLLYLGLKRHLILSAVYNEASGLNVKSAPGRHRWK